MLLWVLFFFAKFKDRIGETYPQLFGENNSEDIRSPEESLSESFGWFGTFYALSQGNITKFEEIEKINVHTCFTYLSFEKQKNEIESKKIKNANKARTY